MEAKLDATVGINPERSQVFVVSLAILSGVAFLIGSAFLWADKPYGWVPFLFSAAFGLGAGWAWFASHKNTDLHGALPTRITVNQTEMHLEADARTLAALDSFQLFERFMSAVGHRAPLPEPDGMVSSSGLPQPDRKQEAMAIVARANEEAAQIAEATKRLVERSVAQLPNSTPSSVTESPNNVAEKPSEDA